MGYVGGGDAQCVVVVGVVAKEVDVAVPCYCLVDDGAGGGASFVLDDGQACKDVVVEIRFGNVDDHLNTDVLQVLQNAHQSLSATGLRGDSPTPLTAVRFLIQVVRKACIRSSCVKIHKQRF